MTLCYPLGHFMMLKSKTNTDKSWYDASNHVQHMRMYLFHYSDCQNNFGTILTSTVYYNFIFSADIGLMNQKSINDRITKSAQDPLNFSVF